MQNNRTKPKWWLRLPLIPLVVVVLLLLPVILLGLALWHFGLLFSIWIFRCRNGSCVLFIYSDSPNWKEYIEQNFLTRFNGKAVILNWSEREKWKTTLMTLAFQRWGGRRDFNPLGVIFRPFHKTKVFRFHGSFVDFKHGKSENLKKLEIEFFAMALTPNN